MSEFNIKTKDIFNKEQIRSIFREMKNILKEQEDVKKIKKLLKLPEPKMIIIDHFNLLVENRKKGK